MYDSLGFIEAFGDTFFLRLRGCEFLKEGLRICLRLNLLYLGDFRLRLDLWENGICLDQSGYSRTLIVWQ